MTVDTLALRERIVSGETSAVSVAEGTLDRIRERDGEVGAFLHVDEDAVMLRARDLDRRLGAGETPGPLWGIPVALKDNLCTRDTPTTCASRILEGWRPPYDATAVRRLLDAGALFVGKTNLDEFAMGSSTERSAYKPTRNPAAPGRVPGGSSGGSTAAVAAGMVRLALGSDTGGSIRQPAALCGVIGLKPTYGRVSRFGLIAFASSLDQIGPIASTAREAALLLDVIAGPDPADATCVDEVPASSLDGIERGVAGMRVGIPAEAFPEGLDAEVAAAVRATAERLASMGAEIVEGVRLPHTAYGIPAYCLVSFSEASSNLARYDGVQYGIRRDGKGLETMSSATRAAGFGDEVKRRIILGTFALSAGYSDAYYLQAQKVRTLIRQDYRNAFESVDCLLTPATPSVAFPLGEKIADPLQMYLQDAFTVGASLAGVPAIAVPAGRSGEGFPIGVQLTGKPYDEGTLLAAAHTLEAVKSGT